MLYFMTNCDNMVSTITLNAPRRARDKELSSMFSSIDNKTTLTTRNKNANSYINGIKIDSNISPDHITTFMNLVPNVNGGNSGSIYYRKLISAHNAQYWKAEQSREEVSSTFWSASADRNGRSLW